MLIVAAAFFSYNVGDAFMRHMNDFYPFLLTGFMTILFYGIFILLFSKQMGGLSSIPKTKYLKFQILRSLGGTGCFICFLYGIFHLSLAQTYTLILTSPFWVVIFAALLKQEAIGWHRIVSIIVGFIGVLVVMRPDAQGFDIDALITLMGAPCFALLILAARRIPSTEPMVNMVFYPMLTDVIVLTILITALGLWTIPVLPHLPFFLLSGAALLTGTMLCARGFSMGESTLLAPLHYTQIIWGTLIGYLFFSEVPDRWTILGALIIVGSGLYLIHREHLASKQA